MLISRDYLQEVQKFITSQYWNSGLRITAGVMIPMFIMIYLGILSTGIPFLFGALFVSLTDTPGPIHHRRNGMLIATALNASTVLITSLLHNHHGLLSAEVLVFSFGFSLFGIYGSRASAIGTLAIVMMLIHMSPLRQPEPVVNTLLTIGGGLWYTVLSLTLYRLQPYRLVEQALGENLMLIAGYTRARAAFYKSDADIHAVFNRVMKEQVEVLKAQTQTRELLFKTRQFVGDASPKSRSLMMIFLESLDLFEETMHAYQDYAALQKNVDEAIRNNFYRVILQVVAEFEHIGLMVQAGMPVKKMPDLSASLDELNNALQEYQRISKRSHDDAELYALQQTLQNIRSIVNRLTKITLYTRLQLQNTARRSEHEKQNTPIAVPLTFSLLKENLTLRSNNFRYALRIVIAMGAGLAVSALFSLSHAYWVLLTITTILKPVYNLTRVRNIQRVSGTLAGIAVGSLVLALTSNHIVLIGLMIFSMLMAYSLLRVNYFGFVLFLTIYILITFHFLDPIQFRDLIGERLTDTIIGSLIAAIAARFIFPVWQLHNIQTAIQKSVIASATYFLAAWNKLRDPAVHEKQYNAARNEAIVTLTNVSDSLQQMLAEPQSEAHTFVHQFVIASQTLTSRISALSKHAIVNVETQVWANAIVDSLQVAATADEKNAQALSGKQNHLPALPPLHPLSIIYSLTNDIRNITVKIADSKNVNGRTS
jgi:uncharacterized membrane protein YccC